jgi:hypothetical protein
MYRPYNFAEITSLVDTLYKNSLIGEKTILTAVVDEKGNHIEDQMKQLRECYFECTRVDESAFVVSSPFI